MRKLVGIKSIETANVSFGNSKPSIGFVTENGGKLLIETINELVEVAMVLQVMADQNKSDLGKIGSLSIRLNRIEERLDHPGGGEINRCPDCGRPITRESTHCNHHSKPKERKKKDEPSD